MVNRSMVYLAQREIIVWLLGFSGVTARLWLQQLPIHFQAHFKVLVLAIMAHLLPYIPAHFLRSSERALFECHP